MNQQFTSKYRNPAFALSFYQYLADNADVFFSIRLVVLKLYNGKRDTVENVHFKQRLFPIPYSYSPYVFVLPFIFVDQTSSGGK